MLNTKLFIFNFMHDKAEKNANSSKKNKFPWLLFFLSWVLSGIYSGAAASPLTYNSTQLSSNSNIGIIPFTKEFNSYNNSNEKIFDESGKIYNPYDLGTTKTSDDELLRQKQNKLNKRHKRRSPFSKSKKTNSWSDEKNKSSNKSTSGISGDKKTAAVLGSGYMLAPMNDQITDILNCDLQFICCKTNDFLFCDIDDITCCKASSANSAHNSWKSKCLLSLFVLPVLFSNARSEASASSITGYNLGQSATQHSVFGIEPLTEKFNSYRYGDIEKIFDEYGNIYNPYDPDSIEELKKYPTEIEGDGIYDQRDVLSCATKEAAENIEKERRKLVAILPEFKSIIAAGAKEDIFDLAYKITTNTDNLIELMTNYNYLCEDGDLINRVNFTHLEIENVIQSLITYDEEYQRLKKANKGFVLSARRFLVIKTCYCLDLLNKKLENLPDEHKLEKENLKERLTILHKNYQEIASSFEDTFYFFYNIPALEKKAANIIKHTEKTPRLNSFEEQMHKNKKFITELLSENSFPFYEDLADKCQTDLINYKKSFESFWDKFGDESPVALPKKNISNSDDTLNIQEKDQNDRFKKIEENLADVRVDLLLFKSTFIKLYGEKRIDEEEKQIIEELTYIIEKYEVLIKENVNAFHQLLLKSEEQQRLFMQNKIDSVICEINNPIKRKKNPAAAHFVQFNNKKVTSLECK